MIKQDLLNFDKNAKTVKGRKQGYMTGILYLAPAKLSGHNVCPFATKGCATACLNTSGYGIFKKVQDGRIKKTLAFFEHKDEFIQKLEKEISFAKIRAKNQKLKLVIRLNGTSDLSVETWGLMEKFPTITFYDYTKNPFRMAKYLNDEMPKNYHLTFSLSENNLGYANTILSKGGNVAIVFNTKETESFPKTFWGYKVVNGDNNDLRFLDGKNVIVGLKMKGKAIYDKSGFIQNVKHEEMFMPKVNYTAPIKDSKLVA